MIIATRGTAADHFKQSLADNRFAVRMGDYQIANAGGGIDREFQGEAHLAVTDIVDHADIDARAAKTDSGSGLKSRASQTNGEAGSLACVVGQKADPVKTFRL